MGNSAPGRKSMLLGTLGDTQKGIWVSFDRRPGMGDHTRYWNDDNTSSRYDDFHNDLQYEKGLELSLFSSKKRTGPQSIQKRNQKSLIQKIYHQGGRQYDGDLKDVEENHAAKDKNSKRKRAMIESTTPNDKGTNKKTRRAEPNSDSLLGLFRQNAQALSSTPDNLEKIRSLMEEEWTNALPLEVLHKSLQEAHSQGLTNACEASPYRKWLERGGPCRVKEYHGNGDDEDDQEDQHGNGDDEDDQEEQHEIGDDDDDQEDQHQEDNDDSEDTDEKEGKEAWEGISDEQTVSAQGIIDAEDDKQDSPSDSERLGVLTAFKFDVELGLIGLHGRNNRQR